MPEPIQTYHTRVSGLWSARHTLTDADGNTLGVLSIQRNRLGMVIGGVYRPEKGEVLTFRRDPGLLRGQFSVWTDGQEWLGSSLRWSVTRRQIDVWTGGKPYRIVPARGLRRGWRVVATKTGEVASIELGLRKAKLELYRKMDFELLLFCYFLGTLNPNESIWPTALDALEHGSTKTPAASKA